MLRHNSVPIANWNSCQNLEVNFISWSETIDKGIPYNRTISLIYRYANCSALKMVFNAKKWADLVSRSPQYFFPT